MNTSKQKGTRAEKAVADYLKANGFPHAERRALSGSADRGDITGTPGICWEVKYRDHEASDGEIARWWGETETERENARADYGVLVVRRLHVGEASAGRWWAYLPVGDITLLVAKAADRPAGLVYARLQAPARLHLADAVRLLRAAGYGTPLEVA